MKGADTFRHRVPSDVTALLATQPAVKAEWDALTPLARNEWVCYVTMVKKPTTRQEHLKRLAEDLQKGKKRPCCWPGCPHRRPQAQKWFR
jgi:uncharacterized protein YdeI (YjbR/CyaY-like superfamily)